MAVSFSSNVGWGVFPVGSFINCSFDCKDIKTKQIKANFFINKAGFEKYFK
jgi:hypothetical protein